MSMVVDVIKAFIIGGIICAVVQIFIDKTKLTPGRIMVGLVVLGSILGAIGTVSYKNMTQPTIA